VSTPPYAISAQQRRLWRRRAAVLPPVAVAVVPASVLPRSSDARQHAVQSALDLVLVAHEALTTSFVARAGRRFPLQVPGGAAAPVVTVLERVDGDPVAAAVASAHSVELDPETGPVLAVTLAGGVDRAALAVAAHPLVADTRSAALVADAVVAGLGGTAPATGVRYVAYADWQRSAGDGDDTTEAEIGELLSVPLPYEMTEASRKDPDEGLRRIPLPARPERAVALAAWSLALTRYVATPALALGVLDAARGIEDLDHAVGPFERLVPLRLEPAGMAREWVAAADAALEHVLSEVAVRAQTPEPDLWRAAFIEVADDTGGSATASAFPIAIAYELAPTFAAILFDPARVPAAIADVLAEEVTGLADVLASEPDRAVEDVGAPHLPVSEALCPERPCVPRVPTPQTASELPAVSAILAHAEAHPERLLLTSSAESLTAGAVAARTDRWIEALSAAGLEPEELAAVLLPRGLDAVSAYLGSIACGATIVPVDPTALGERTDTLLALADPTVYVTLPGAACPFPGAGHVVVGPDGTPVVAGVADRRGRRLPGGCYLLGTSGSTGVPKVVPIGIDNVRAYRDAMASVLELTPADVVLHSASFTFSSAMRQLLLPLEAGARVRLAGTEELSDPSRLLRSIVDEQITVLDFVPSYWRLVVSSLESDLTDLRELFRSSQVRLLLSASEPLPSALAAKLLDTAPEATLINMFGQTETTGIVRAHRVNRAALRRPTAPLGAPLPGVGSALVDARGGVAPVGHVGEIVVAGDTVGAGYLDAGTGETGTGSFDEIVIDGMPVRAFRTGDLARTAPDGSVDYVGRLDRQVKVRGVRVSIAEVEAALLRHPAVAECAVIVDQPREGGAVLHAYLVPMRDQRPTTVDLKSFLQTIIPSVMAPSRYTLLTTLPRLPSGKIALSELRAAAESQQRAHSVAEYVAPRTEADRRMIALWAEVLDVPKVGMDDNFFDLGGHSLLGIDLLQRLRAETGVVLEWSDLFAARTPAKLAERAAQARRSTTVGSAL
jgi:acyl-coenzyme A synthetase/AMP-(fatty) acid ligase